MPVESIGKFIPLIPDNDKASHEAYVDLSRSKIPSLKAFQAAIKAMVQRAEIYRKDFSSLTFLAYGRDMKDDDLNRYNLVRPVNTTHVIDYLTSFHSKRVRNSLSDIEHLLTVQLPQKVEEAKAVSRGDMPASFAKMLNKEKDPQESVRSWFYRTLFDAPFDFVEYDQVFPSRSDSFVLSHNPQHVLREISDWFEVDDSYQYLFPEVLERIWNNLWKVRRLMNGQVDLAFAQKQRNPSLVRWFEKPLVDPLNLPQQLSAYFSKRGKVSFYELDSISCKIVLTTSSGDRFSYQYYDALGQLVDDQARVHEIENLLKQLKEGRQDDVSHALGMYEGGVMNNGR